jgi:hypothetical protein
MLRTLFEKYAIHAAFFARVVSASAWLGMAGIGQGINKSKNSFTSKEDVPAS